MHCPKDEAGRQELEKRAALIHAQTTSEKLAALPYPAEEKLRIIDEIIRRRRETR